MEMKVRHAVIDGSVEQWEKRACKSSEVAHVCQAVESVRGKRPEEADLLHPEKIAKVRIDKKRWTVPHPETGAFVEHSELTVVPLDTRGRPAGEPTKWVSLCVEGSLDAIARTRACLQPHLPSTAVVGGFPTLLEHVLSQGNAGGDPGNPAPPPADLPRS
eukprot:TRINITY_DN23561_c0_g1_i2.p2 TRINITY_DN23561_c0_g1~~TRINITY_DN23561_c0_g1_i2.p2  ORF type:complete len:160 (+),score=27.63 TRINITY_DN23561_c0_g1_i2:280-759(+)